jgi:hypothetical protein
VGIIATAVKRTRVARRTAGDQARTSSRRAGSGQSVGSQRLAREQPGGMRSKMPAASGSPADVAACTRLARNAQTRSDRPSQAHSRTIQSSEAWHGGIAGGRGGEGDGGAPQSAEQDPAQRRAR